jgi:GT2 family glycosyltransferase
LKRRKSRADRVLVVVPVHGHHQMTHELIADLDRESDVADVVVVDNRGDYPAISNEEVVRPGSNLGWAGGTNFGTRERGRPEHAGFVWLNNDTRLCAGFVAGLLGGWRQTRAGLVGPWYDCYWLHQRPRRTPPVAQYRPRSIHFKASFVDGTCMFVPASTIELIGMLDAETFAPIGWGADIDYGLRARAAQLDVVITGLAYLHHEKSITGKTVFEGGLEEYAARGYPVLMGGLRRKWGDDWQRMAGIDPATGQTRPPGLGARLRRRALSLASASRSRSSRRGRSAR